MGQHKPPERRTFLQDRLDILIKKQRSGTATFNELTELDEIVNRDPEIRKRIIMEDLFAVDPDSFDEPEQPRSIVSKPPVQQTFLQKAGSFINRIFNSVTFLKAKIAGEGINQMVLI